MILAVPRLPAIGDLGQELVNPVDFFFRPEIYGDAAGRNCFWRWNLPQNDVIAQR